MSDLSQLKPKTFHSISHDWFGKAAPAKIEYALIPTDTTLLFWAQCAQQPWHDAGRQCGDFIEGLWQMDVAEFFLRDDMSSAYQEFNLAPSGAWWTGVFSGYRCEAETQPAPPHVRCFSEINEHGWQAALEVQRSDLAIDISFGAASRANVCFIIGEGDSKQFFTAGDLGGGKPDFHKIDVFPHFSDIA